MILVWFFIILVAAGLLSWIAGHRNKLLPRWISLIALILNLVLAFSIWGKYSGEISLTGERITEVNYSWIPQFGISFHLWMDGLSFLMVILSFFIGILSILTSWKHVSSSTGFFHFNMMFLLAGIIGVFLAADLFLFFFFWELMLVPMYFIISMWGYEKRVYASTKFFIFTQGSGLLMLLSILGLYFIHGRNTGTYTFDYFDLLGTDLPYARWIMTGFFFAFVVKLPMVPFHTWLPDATTEAPSVGSVVLAGLLWNTGAYGILRFVIPLFPDASHAFAPIALTLGIAGIIYAAKLAFAQIDLKKLIVYTSISHMGFLMVGIYTFNELAMQGVIIQLFTHTISTSALLILAAKIQEQMNIKDIGKMGGLWTSAPVMSGVGLVFVMDTLALPGLGNFVSEFLILLGAFQVNVLFTVLASLGIIASCIYSLRIAQKVFYGLQPNTFHVGDFNLREAVIMTALVIPSFFFGLYPRPLFKLTNPSIKNLLPAPDLNGSAVIHPVKTGTYILTTKDFDNKDKSGKLPDNPKGGAN